MTFESREEASRLLDDFVKSGLKDFKAVRYVREVYDNMFEATSVCCGNVAIFDDVTRSKAVGMVSFLFKNCYLSNERGLGKTSEIVKLVFIHIDDDNTTYITTLWLIRKA